MKKIKKETSANLSTILLTGFGSFDEFNRNPSGDIVEELDGSIYSTFQIRGVKIPVAWENSWELIEQEIKRYHPVLVLSLGLAPEPNIRLEICANNQNAPFFDENGKRPAAWPNSQIVESGPIIYPSSLPLDWLYSEYQQLDSNKVIPIRFSNDAGKYLCNYVFYKAMYHLKGAVLYRGFIHIPAYNIALKEGITSRENIFPSVHFIIEKLIEWLSRENQSQLFI